MQDRSRGNHVRERKRDRRPAGKQGLRLSDIVARIEEDTVARLGGDEFAVLVERLHDSADAVRVAERIHTSLAVPFALKALPGDAARVLIEARPEW